MAGKKDPFEDEDEGSEGTEQKSDAKVIEEEGEELELEDKEEEEDDPAPTRKEKRRNRYREAHERAELAERARAEAERTAQLALERLQAAERQSHGQQQTQTDPHQEELDGLYREQDLLHREWALLSDEQKAAQGDTFVAKSRDIQQRQYAAVARREAEKMGVRPHNPGNEYIQQRIITDFPDVAGHTGAMNYARAYCQMKINLGRTMDWNLMTEAMNEARRQPEFGLSRQPAPTRETQSRYTAGPRGGAAAGGTTRPVIKMNKHYMSMAEARYPNDPPKVAYQKWANTVGRKLLAKESS